MKRRAAAAKKYLIVNADDFGLSAGVNRGIIQAHERGIVTSASLMVRQPAAAEAAEYARGRPELSVGLHFDLGEWVYRDGAWVQAYEVVAADRPELVAAELERQLAAFRSLMRQDPTHVDSHQHVHRDQPARDLVLSAVREIGIPVRHFAAGIAYRGDFYGQTAKGEPYPEGIRVERLLALLSEIAQGGSAIIEAGCHPGYADGLASPYAAERELEVAALCDPRLRAALREHGIELISFAGVQGR
jgi:predicted glycoside hydrolase/deacetylase ChbG (UPF0249 family)